MNVKIKEFAKKSGIAYFLPNGSVVSPWIEDTDIRDYVEEFADLIVKECCKIIKEEENDALNTFRYMGDSPPGRDYISEIKKHFGINDEQQD